MKHSLILLTLIILLGSLLRFYGITVQSLWTDELVSWKYANVESFKEAIRCTYFDTNPPGYQIILYNVIKYFGDSERVLRMPSVISGILAIPAIYLLGLILFTYKEGLMAAALMAVMLIPVEYSQEARCYSMLLLMTIISMIFLIEVFRALKSEGSPAASIVAGYVVSAVMVSYLHYFGLYLVVLQLSGMAVLLYKKRSFAMYFIPICCVIVLAYVPWIHGFLNQMRHNIHGIRYIDSPTTGSIVMYLKELCNLSDNLFKISIFVLLLAFAKTLWAIVKNRQYSSLGRLFDSPSVFIVAWLIIPIAGAFLFSKISLHVFASKYLFISLPAAYLLFSRSLTAILESGRAQLLVALIITGGLLYHLVVERQYYTYPFRDQYREVIAYSLEQSRMHKNAAIIGYSFDRSKFDYYRLKNNMPEDKLLFARTKEGIAQIRNGFKGRRPDYVVFFHAGTGAEPDEEFIKSISESYAVRDSKDFKGGKVLVLGPNI